MAIGEDFGGVLSAAQSGAGWAFEVLYGTFAPAVAGYLRAQGAEADDLASEVFLRVFRDLGSFSGTEGQFRSWVFTIAHARLIDERARLRRRVPLARNGLDGASETAGGNVEDDVLGRLAEARVRELCAGLAPDQRDVLLLRLVADLTVEQVAATLEKTVGATKALQRRGLAGLRREIERKGVPL